MKLLPYSLAALLLFGTYASAAPDPSFRICLCFGQSNMESGGKMDEADRTVDKRFQVMADFDSTNRGWKKGQWYDAVPPLAAKGRGICMVNYFGRTMVAGLPENIRVGVIKVSVPEVTARRGPGRTRGPVVDWCPRGSSGRLPGCWR
jgi:hypothetical protein